MNQEQSLDELQHIKRMMERSSRFISLSGLSGVSAGICALVGAWFANRKISCWVNGDCQLKKLMDEGGNALLKELILIAALTFIAAFLTAFFFTYLRSKKNKSPIWGATSWRLFWNTIIPIGVGGIFLIKLMQEGEYNFVSSGCLLFYGLALVNASKYTLNEVRYLGYSQLLLGIVNLWFVGSGLYFWALGFGVLHILYGIAMWWKYEKNAE